MKLSPLTLCLASCFSGAVEFTYTELSTTGNNIALGYPVPLPVDSLTPVDGFRSYSSLNLRHQQLTAETSLITQHKVGQTLSGRDIWAYQFSDSDEVTVSGAREGSALINGGIHAREWQSPEALTGYMETLFSGQPGPAFSTIYFRKPGPDIATSIQC